MAASEPTSAAGSSTAVADGECHGLIVGPDPIVSNVLRAVGDLVSTVTQ
jgi:hypothetical protein